MGFYTSIVFLGTPNFALQSLKKLAENGFSLDLILTNPDRPKGRGLGLSKTPVKVWAEANHQNVMDDFNLFLDLAKENFRQNIWQAKSINQPSNPLLVIVAYGKILPKFIIDNFTSINLHASLLPIYRGASPIQTTLLNGDKKTGLSTMLINEKMDAGDILLQTEKTIAINQDYLNLQAEMADLGADLLTETLKKFKSIKPIKQDDSKSSYCKKILKTDSLIDLSWDYLKIHNITRAIGAYFFIKQKRIIITKSLLRKDFLTPIAKSYPDDSLNKLLNLSRFLELYLKPEGKKEMPLTEYFKGLT